MDPDFDVFAALFPDLTRQLRTALSNLHLAAGQLAPASAREADPQLDARAARLDQSYFQLLRLVNNLSLAADLRQSPPLSQQDTEVVELLAELCRECTDLAGSLGVELRFVCAMSAHVCTVSPFALEQIFFQLLSNALKHTAPGGSVTVELRQEERRLVLSVTDTGGKFPDEPVPALFDQLLREDEDPSPHGLGLGLWLCRRLAREMDGSLLADVRPGKYTRLSLSLPDRITGDSGVSDVKLDYTGGFNRTLLALADALPASAFRIRNRD